MESLLKLIFRRILRAKGFRVVQVSSIEEEQKVAAFARQIQSQEGYPDHYLNMLYKYYDNCVTFAVYHKEELIGSLRLIDPNGPCRILDFWHIEFPKDVPLSEFREIGSLVINKDYRGKSRWPMTALLEGAYHYSRDNGIKWWFASANQDKYQKFKKMNPSCVILEKLTPTEHQLTNRTRYRDFFDKAKTSVVFGYSLDDAKYSKQFKRILKKKFKAKTSRKK